MDHMTDWALVVSTIALTVVTLGADNAIVKIVKTLAPRRNKTHGKHEAQ